MRDHLDALPPITGSSSVQIERATKTREAFVNACNAGIVHDWQPSEDNRDLIASCLHWYIQHRTAVFWVRHGGRPPISQPVHIGYWWARKREHFAILEEVGTIEKTGVPAC